MELLYNLTFTDLSPEAKGIYVGFEAAVLSLACISIALGLKDYRNSRSRYKTELSKWTVLTRYCGILSKISIF